MRVLSETSLEPEAAPKAGLTCKATSPQANDEWCNGSCNENPDDGGAARAFASVSRLEGDRSVVPLK